MKYPNFLQQVNGLWAIMPEVYHNGALWVRDVVMNGSEASRQFYQENKEEFKSSLPGNLSDDPDYKWGSRWGIHIKNGVAIVPIYGTVVKRSADLGWSQTGVSSDRMAIAFDKLAQDPNVESVVLDVDSPGGMVAGLETAVQAMRNLAQTKKVTAVCNALMASAAYHLSSQATEIVVTSGSTIGAIGVIMGRMEVSKNNDRGTIHVISSYPEKAFGHPFVEMSSDERSHWKSLIDEAYGIMRANILATRPQMADHEEDGMRGKVFSNEGALRFGLADREGTLDSALESHGLRRRTFFARLNPRNIIQAAREAMTVESTTGDIVEETLTNEPEADVVEETLTAPVEESEQLEEQVEGQPVESSVKPDDNEITQDMAQYIERETARRTLTERLIDRGHLLPKDKVAFVTLQRVLSGDADPGGVFQMTEDDEPSTIQEWLIGYVERKTVWTKGELTGESAKMPVDPEDPVAVAELIRSTMKERGFKSSAQAYEALKQEGVLP